MVDGQHDGTAGRRTENARKPVLHSPVQRIGSLQEEWLVHRRLVQVKILGFARAVNIGHIAFSFHSPPDKDRFFGRLFQFFLRTQQSALSLQL
jgi:hypothetical protein